MPQNQQQVAPMNVSWIQFGLGLLVVLAAAALLLLDVMESGFAAAMGLVGIVLIASSGNRTHHPT